MHLGLIHQPLEFLLFSDFAVILTYVNLFTLFMIVPIFNAMGLCCTNSVKDSSRESSVVAGLHEQTYTLRLQDQELARV